MVTGAWVCLLLPLLGCVLITLGGNLLTRRAAAWVSTLTTYGAFAGALVSFFSMLSRSGGDRVEVSTAWTWLSAGTFHAGFSVLVDPLSVFMMLIVSGVGGLIIHYSIGYMDGDDEERRYFAYMSLFVFSMLMLVEGGNLLLLLVGWGLVGLSSYLLIGFWHHRPSAVAAAKKAFVMNALGDATMALALFLLIQHTRTLDYFTSFHVMGGLGHHTALVNLVALGLLGGAVAKSAQLPLQTWLPDAMEGPTPVSALIHAATMVTAGVYLIVRTHPLFELAPKVEELAAGLGTLTLLLAGLIALVQTDIKRVIAYSTMSQIGYMFLGAGLGAYGNGMFHLMTHAFFKALLFMAAGVVIHALAGEQDIRKMGGLRRLMPFTYATFLVGSLALVGIFPLAGFFSKDSILAAAMSRGWYGYLLWIGGLVGAFLTGVYTFRMFFVVFGGEPSAFVQEHLFRGHGSADHGHELAPNEPGDEPAAVHADAGAHHGEGPWTMLFPVGVLAVLAVVGGWIQWAPMWHGVSTWLDPVARPLAEPKTWQEALSSILGLALGLAGMGVAWVLYGARRARVPRPSRALERKLYFDELYDVLFYWPSVGLAKFYGFAVERGLIAGSVAGVAGLTRGLGQETRGLQTGLVRTYVLMLAAAVAVLIVVFVAVR